MDWIHLDPEAGCFVYDNDHFGSVNAGSFSPPTNPTVVSRMELVQNLQM